MGDAVALVGLVDDFATVSGAADGEGSATAAAYRKDPGNDIMLHTSGLTLERAIVAVRRMPAAPTRRSYAPPRANSLRSSSRTNCNSVGDHIQGHRHTNAAALASL